MFLFYYTISIIDSSKYTISDQFIPFYRKQTDVTWFNNRDRGIRSGRVFENKKSPSYRLSEGLYMRLVAMQSIKHILQTTDFNKYLRIKKLIYPQKHPQNLKCPLSASEKNGRPFVFERTKSEDAFLQIR